MARSHGRIFTSIWNDADFIALNPREQRLYLFLLSQPDLSQAGLLPLRVRRWAKKAADLLVDDLLDDLAALEDARFIVTDEDTEELLLRTFVRNDGVYKQPKVMLRMREDARLIESPNLRAAFRAELDRLPLDELSDEPPSRGGPSCREVARTVIETLRTDFGPVEETLPDTHSEGYAEPTRVRAPALHQPPTTIHLPPATVPPTAGGDEVARRDDHEASAQVLVGEWVDACQERPPSRVIGHVARELKTMLDEGIDPARVRNGLIEWNRRGLHPSTLPSVVHEMSEPRRRGNSRVQETNDIFDRAAVRLGLIQGGDQ